jgi:hypothetical protein
MLLMTIGAKKVLRIFSHWVCWHDHKLKLCLYLLYDIKTTS